MSDNLPDVSPQLPPDLDRLTGATRKRAEQMWSDLWLVGEGTYTETDAFVIERYISLQLRRSRLLAMLDHEGLMVVGSQGQPVAHPAIRAVATIEAMLPGLEDKLGLTPDSRRRLGMGGPSGESTFDSFIEALTSEEE
jgi:P27 family predicted phage terminase small subunit